MLSYLSKRIYLCFKLIKADLVYYPYSQPNSHILMPLQLVKSLFSLQVDVGMCNIY